MLSLPILTVLIAFTHGCISSGDEGSDGKRILELRSKNVASLLNEKFIENYLTTFGYLRDDSEVPELEKMKNDKEILEVALKSFQEFMGLSSTGRMDTTSGVLMMRKRCSEKDKLTEHEKRDVWEKSVLTFNITNYPETLKESDFREILHQAFAAWEVVIPMDFVEVKEAEKADIVFSFEDPLNGWINDPTHLSIAGASDIPKARIWISQDEAWGVNNELDQTNSDLFNVLVHEIGHILGLDHSSDPNSMMYPLFEREVDQVHPEVTNNDVEKLRNLYEVVDIDTDLNSELDSIQNSSPKLLGGLSSKCPLNLQAISRAPDGELLIFNDDQVWRALNNSIVTDPVEIFQVFPSGPSYVNTSSTVGSSVVLISDREIYVFHQENSEFILADGYPKMLHERVLFYPEASFVLKNGSLVLLSDNVFATYDLENNVPTMLNDKTVYFPNLPDELRSGIPESPESDESEVYQMFTSDKVYKYDFKTQEIVDNQPLTTFFTCDL